MRPGTPRHDRAYGAHGRSVRAGDPRDHRRCDRRHERRLLHGARPTVGTDAALLGAALQGPLPLPALTHTLFGDRFVDLGIARTANTQSIDGVDEGARQIAERQTTEKLVA